MTVKKNYESHAQHLKDIAKENPDYGKDAKESKGHKRRLFAYSFDIMDLDSSRHMAFGYSVHSSRDLSYMNILDDTKVFVIPKKNATLNGSQKRKDTMNFLVKYHQRSNSESGFAADKKMLGWNVSQKRNDRIDNALFCTGVWHNIFNMGRS